MKKQLHFETAISRAGKKNYNNGKLLLILSRILWGIVCILHSFTHSRSFQVYNKENSCKHLLNIACRLEE